MFAATIIMDLMGFIHTPDLRHHRFLMHWPVRTANKLINGYVELAEQTCTASVCSLSPLWLAQMRATSASKNSETFSKVFRSSINAIDWSGFIAKREKITLSTSPMPNIIDPFASHRATSTSYRLSLKPFLFIWTLRGLFELRGKSIRGLMICISSSRVLPEAGTL